MPIRVISVKEGRALNTVGQVSKVIIVTYTVGTFGPFTWQGTQDDFSGGKAQLAMQQFAATIAAQPGVTAS